MTDGKFELDSGEALTKPNFFLGDEILEDENFMIQGELRWLRIVGVLTLFLPNMIKMCALAYLHNLSVP